MKLIQWRFTVEVFSISSFQFMIDSDKAIKLDN